MGNNDPSDVTCTIITNDPTIGSFVVKEFTGGDFDAIQDASPNEGPGGRRFGFNLQRNANGCEISFSVRDSSPDVGKLFEISRRQIEIAIAIEITDNVDQYDDGELLGFSTPRGILSSDSFQRGRGEADDVGFTVHGIGYIIQRKNETPIVQGF